jgi:Ni/Fe-hydrogenase subunit HybB-like protein
VTDAGTSSGRSAESIVREAHTPASLSREISSIALEPKTTRLWFGSLLVSLLLVAVLFWSIAKLLITGVGIWGIDIPIAWGYAITNFVWWAGIAHAGTIIAALLLLLHQNWRTSINRFAEAMTLFALAVGGLFPLLHLGRPFRFYWMAPYPNTTGLWPQFRSPLTWDFFAIGIYALVAFMFLYLGLLPDLATFRDRARGKLRKRVYGFFSLGWRGGSRQWQRFRKSYILMAGLAVPLVVSVHSVSFNFSVSIVPGWHMVVFPPFFVSGAIFSGVAMVLLIGIPLRRLFHLQELITRVHLDHLAKLLLITGLGMAYGYLNQLFLAWFSGEKVEQFLMLNRMIGPYWPLFWLMVLCNFIAIQVLWWRSMRRSPKALFVIALLVSVGMWSERFIMVVTSLHRDYMPSAWGMFYPSLWDWTLLIGSVGLFATLFLLFMRFVPVMSMSEIRELMGVRGQRSGVRERDDLEERRDEGSEKESRSGSPDPRPPTPDPRVRHFGLLAEFEREEDLLDAVIVLREMGYRLLEAYTPHPIAGLAELLGSRRTWLPPIVLGGAVSGIAAGYLMQFYASVVHYPQNIGGKPYHSWPAFIPISLEFALLFGALGAAGGFLILSGLPRLHHPLFNSTRFERATTDRFFLCAEAADRKFDRARTRKLLERFTKLPVEEVAW